MRLICFILFLFIISTFKSQNIENKLKNYLSNSDWIQINKEQNRFNKFGKDSTIIVLYGDYTYGNILQDNSLEMKIGNWKIKNDKIILIDSYLHGTEFNCNVQRENENIINLTFYDVDNEEYYIQLKRKNSR